ncbi:hypothetical protein EVAR_77343_1 [Eumeta japonica]|uniref:Uncharacterized protein n=1 Tax=Eumeta variegata TaxID=151549 RepID=A0A4C1UX68_EUMVA|nr:hypothetical protein EVAR_77343_1 [Eumeta japonica]
MVSDLTGPRECGGGAGVHRATAVIGGNAGAGATDDDDASVAHIDGACVTEAAGTNDGDAGGHHGERRSGAGLSGARSSTSPAPTADVVSIAVASDVITDDWKKRSGNTDRYKTTYKLPLAQQSSRRSYNNHPGAHTTTVLALTQKSSRLLNNIRSGVRTVTVLALTQQPSCHSTQQLFRCSHNNRFAARTTAVLALTQRLYWHSILKRSK